MVALLCAIILKISVFGLCFFLIQKKRNLAIIDIFWGLSFLPEILVAFLFFGFNANNFFYIIIFSMWSLRLSYFLGMRLKQKGRDKRYEKLSKDWPEEEFSSMALKKVVMPQGLISLAMGLCSYMVLFINQEPMPTIITGWAVTLFVFGFCIEAVADGQLSQFKRRQRPEVYTGGLWSLVRYPNYLGEILIWTSFAVFALGKPFGFLGLLSPMAIAFFLIKVTGIPYLEKSRSSRETFPNPRPKYFLIPFIY